MDELKRLCDAGEIVKVKRGVYDLPSRAHSIDLPLEYMTILESMSDVTVESNGKAFRLRVNRKPGQAEGEAVIRLFPKSKKYSTTMHAIEGGQRSPLPPPDTPTRIPPLVMPLSFVVEGRWSGFVAGE